MRIAITFGACVACFEVAAALACPTGKTASPTPDSLPALDAAIAGCLKSGGIPGASVVVIEHGRIVMARDYGLADRERHQPVSPDTVFRAGSISKTLTAIAVMQLVERGRVQLDAPMFKLMTEWKVQGTADPAYPLRLEHLLEHTAGLDDIRYRHYLIEGRDITLTQALPLFGPYSTRWSPGTGTAYSNAGPIVVGRLIEQLGGDPFEVHMARAVTGPLGMTSARWMRDAAQANVLAASYQSDGRTPEPYVETPGRPSGSLSTTSRDLARLPLMLIGRGMLDGQHLLAETSIERMERPATSVAAARGVPIGWGLALRADADGRTVFFGHDGSIDGFVARFAYAPRLGAGYVVMANATSDAAIDAGRLVRSYLERSLAAPSPTIVPTSADQRRRWAGEYQSFTPRQELLRAVIGLTQWEGASFDGEMLKFEGARWVHVGDGKFQKPGAAAPALLFVDRDRGVEAHTHDGAKRRIGSAEMAAKLGGISLTVLALLAGLCALPVWALAASRGRLVAYGGLAPRLWPLAALWSAVAVPVGVLSLLGSGDLALLGRPSAWGYAVYAASWLAPVVAVVAAVALWRLRAARWGRTARAFAWIQLTLTVMLLGWLTAHGWIGLRVWDA
jgi:CubicO group peptidase (beta-lactamase class C family)